MAKIKIILSQILPYFYQLLVIFFIVQSPVALGFQRKCPELSPETLLYEMCELFDIYTEEAIKKEVYFRV